MAPLANIALLVLFAIVIFAIIGLEVYNGQLYYWFFLLQSFSNCTLSLWSSNV